MTIQQISVFLENRAGQLAEITTILADNQNGYYLPETQEDVELFYKSMLHRAAEITRVATAVKLRGRRLD